MISFAHNKETLSILSLPVWRRIHTSYVNVEPKRRRQVSYQRGEVISATTVDSASPTTTATDALPSSDGESPSLTSNVAGAAIMEDLPPTSSLSSSSIPDSKKNIMSVAQQAGQRSVTASSSKNPAPSSSGGSRELRRARILVTVKRTESYKRWLEENPSQRQAIIAGTASVTAEDIVGGNSSSNNEQISSSNT